MERIKRAAARATALAACAAGLALFGSVVPAHAFSGKHFVKEATVALQQAREIALKRVPGKIVDEELERGKGSSSLRYSFDIVNAHTRHEVWVDAKTGQVLRLGK